MFSEFTVNIHTIDTGKMEQILQIFIYPTPNNYYKNISPEGNLESWISENRGLLKVG